MTEYTRYEQARILGARSLQIAMGAPSFVDTEGDESPIDIAKQEMEADKLPITVK
ncbi:DNA-directed RNA polymerase subunit K [Candidatus Nanohalovita haloferacivicina]|uniref:DNA-directed RNA polymerase subunit K n=1 Tax=Candidatus Nanohalovita haloferacivicina TaxID=2978046 RepID=UPI00325FADF7